MFFAVTNLARAVDEVDFSDITTAARTGPAYGVEGGVEIPFAVDPTPDQANRILARITAATPNEETLKTRALGALASNTNWRTNTVPQLLAGADKILTGTLALTASQQEKDLAQAVKTLTNRVDALCEQNNALIRLLLNRFDATT